MVSSAGNGMGGNEDEEEEEDEEQEDTLLGLGGHDSEASDEDGGIGEYGCLSYCYGVFCTWLTSCSYPDMVKLSLPSFFWCPSGDVCRYRWSEMRRALTLPGSCWYATA